MLTRKDAWSIFTRLLNTPTGRAAVQQNEAYKKIDAYAKSARETNALRRAAIEAAYGDDYLKPGTMPVEPSHGFGVGPLKPSHNDRVDEMVRDGSYFNQAPIVPLPSPDNYVPHTEIVTGTDIAGQGDTSVLTFMVNGKVIRHYEIVTTIYVITANDEVAVKVARLVLSNDIPDLYKNSMLVALAWRSNYPSYSGKKYRPYAVHIGMRPDEFTAVEIISDCQN